MACGDRCTGCRAAPGVALSEITTALVTGASRGIGEAIATELAARGVRVVITARDAEALRLVAEKLSAHGAAVDAIPADIAEPAQAEAMVWSAIEQLGQVDLFVSNAAVLEPIAPVWEADLSSVERAFQVNLLGPWRCLQVLLPRMIRRGRGTIAAISSSSARQAFSGLGSYCASKAAFEQLHLVAARDCARAGVDVKVIWPGGVDTDMQAQLRSDAFPAAASAREVADRGLLRDPQEVARLIVDVCEDAVGFDGDVFDVDAYSPL